MGEAIWEFLFVMAAVAVICFAIIGLGVVLKGAL
jgi:hypothetical protein